MVLGREERWERMGCDVAMFGDELDLTSVASSPLQQ